jgi:hypothetical protein
MGREFAREILSIPDLSPSEYAPSYVSDADS